MANQFDTLEQEQSFLQRYSVIIATLIIAVLTAFIWFVNSYTKPLQTKTEVLTTQQSEVKTKQQETILNAIDASLAQYGISLDNTKDTTLTAQVISISPVEVINAQDATTIEPENVAKVQDLLNQQLIKGFNALSANQYETAIELFNEILTQYPQNNAASNGLATAQSKLHQQQLQQIWLNIQQHQQFEQWSDALANINILLQLDPHHLQAQALLPIAQQRSQWYKKLEEFINQPIKLTRPSVAVQANILLDEIGERSGKRLNEKTSKLSELLDWVKQDQQVILHSDNKTDVTVHQFGYLPQNLGLFERKVLLLKPGEYKLTGRRKGFRDNLITVVLNKPDSITEYTIICEHSIADR